MANTTTTYGLNLPKVNDVEDQDLWGGQLNTNTETIEDELGAAFADVASASTADIGAASSRNVRITGTTTITSFGTSNAGITRRVRFADVLTLTHNGTSLILPSGDNITTAANDCLVAVSLGSGNWIVSNYIKASGETLIAATDALLGGVEKATQSEMEAETANKYPDAALLKFHPGVTKAWIAFNGSGGASVLASYNMAVSRTSAGRYAVSFGDDLSSANYSVQVSRSGNAGASSAPSIATFSAYVGNLTTSGFDIFTGSASNSSNNTWAAADCDLVMVQVFGDF